MAARSCLALLVLALLATGCSKRVPATVTSLGDPATTAATARTPRVQVEGWVDRDGHVHVHEGYVEVRGDSLRFVSPARPARGLELDRPEYVTTVHRDSVAEVRTIETDYVASVFMALLLVGLVGGFMLLGAAASLDEPML